MEENWKASLDLQPDNQPILLREQFKLIYWFIVRISSKLNDCF